MVERRDLLKGRREGIAITRREIDFLKSASKREFITHVGKEEYERLSKYGKISYAVVRAVALLRMHNSLDFQLGQLRYYGSFLAS